MNVQLNQKHPGPDKSLLWDHIDLIKGMLREGNRWEDIAEQLCKKRGICLHKSTVCNFYKRLIHRRKPLPNGIKDDRRIAQKEPRKLSFTRSEIHDAPRRLQVID